MPGLAHFSIIAGLLLIFALPGRADEQRDDVSILEKAYLLDRVGEDPWDKLRLLEAEQRMHSMRFCLALEDETARQRCIKYIARDSGMLPMSRGQ